ncbi:hypothetical protein, partial [Candidatus Thiosymbion oneisti]|uniref:hypothetical protein n=1 Tax=Candidatus Thiosymbion oneisti TaxID=589554 RepID=UPI001A9CA368
AGGQAVTWANFFNHVSDPATVGNPDEAYPDWYYDATNNTTVGATPVTNKDCANDRGIERRAKGDWDPDTAATSACRNLITAQEPYVFL